MTQAAILGAGIAGLSSGWMLRQMGIDFIILEKQSYIGGLARSFQWNGFDCDFAAHRLFTSEEDILQRLLELVPMVRHIRRSRIYLAKHWMRDPLDLIELGTNLSTKICLEILWSYLTRPRNIMDDSFENYVIRRYGKSLYNLFFQPYTEKLFGVQGNDISVYWAREKVRLTNPFDNLQENTKTKSQYFFYPIEGGYGSIVNRLYQQVQDYVKLETEVLGFEQQDRKLTEVIYRQNNTVNHLPIDFVISTLPFTTTGRMLGYDFQLKFQKVKAVYLLINQPLVSDLHWIYFFDSDLSINRLVEFKNMSSVNTPSETTVLCAEVTRHLDNVIDQVIDDLVNVGLINRADILDSKIVQENFSYPVYDKVYDRTINKSQETLKKFKNLFLVGRAAEYRHREVDDIFATAISSVNTIAQQIPSHPL